MSPAAVMRTGRFLERPWGRLRVWESGGGGAVLIALHGLGGSGRYWDGLASTLDGGFTVVAPDLAGFGRSDKPDMAYDRGLHLDNLDALVEQVAPRRRVVVVGHSIGGVLAAAWAARRPERVEALALVTAPFPSPRADAPVRLAENGSGGRGRRRAHAVARTLWPLLTAPLGSRLYPRAVVADYLRHTPPSYWGTLHGLLYAPDAIATLGGLSALRGRPALLLNAVDDRRIGPGCAERWAALLPDATREVVAGGHQLLLRTHFAPLAGWLERLPRDAGAEPGNAGAERGGGRG